MASKLSTRLLAGAAALTLIATACAGSDDVDPTAERELEEFQSTTTGPTTTEAPPVTDATTTTSTTEAPPATEAPTTIAVVPATEAPTTTGASDPRDAAIAAALQESADSWVRCAEASPNCDPAILAESRAGDQLEASIDIVLGSNNNGETTSNLESYRIQLQSIEYFSDTVAEVKACIEDGLVVTGRTGEVVNDAFRSSINRWTFEQIDGTWKITTGVRLQKADGQENTLCEF